MIVILLVLGRPYGALSAVPVTCMNALTREINFGVRGDGGSDLRAGCSI
jgi:hypothetical protein